MSDQPKNREGSLSLADEKTPPAYPLAGVVLTLFTIYQVYLFSHSGSLFQLFLTAVDVLILLLLWSEYRRVAQRAKPLFAR